MQWKAFSRLTAAVCFFAAAFNLLAQGTAISYQGQLHDSGSLANTNYDFRFGVFNAVTNGSQLSVWLTNTTVPVSNGLFMVTLNFGASVFNGTANGSNDWLDVAVRPAGTANFTVLTPRQPILPVPYALFALSASNLLGTLPATQLTGTVASGVVSGSYSNGVNFVNATNSFFGAFSGNGVGLTNLNATNLVAGTISDARLPADVALLGQTQVFTGSNSFTGASGFGGSVAFTAANRFTASNSFSGLGFYSGANSFTNFANSFSGSFFGNGLVGWLPLYATSTNASRDVGILTSNSSLTTVTLPPSSALSVGDIIRVSGGGPGGWLVQENSGQSIVGSFAAFRNSRLAALSNISGDLYGVAGSADGRVLYAVGMSLNYLYSSSDGGISWANVSGTQLSGNFSSVACSANGKIVYVQPTPSGYIQESTNYGATWFSSGTNAGSTAIACTADGTLLTGVACSGNGTYRGQIVSGVVKYSSNSGTGYTPVSTAPVSGVTCMAVSSDCTKIVAGVSNGLLYASSDQGKSWTTLTFSNQNWSAVWMAPDGSKLAGSISGSGGTIFYCNVLPVIETANANATIGGSRGSAVELQYVGGGLFVPVGSSGLLWSN